MSRENSSPQHKRRLLRTLTIVGLAVVGIGTLASSALFTDTQSVGSHAFTNGTIDLTATPATTALTAANMAPGDSVYGTIAVANAGTLPMRYAVTSTATNLDTKALASQLLLTIKTGVAVCDAAGFASGTTVYTAGVLGGLGSAVALIGDVTTGQQTGDRVLAAGANETLCVKVNLPTATSNTYQGATTTGTFTFAAEQTTNN